MEGDDKETPGDEPKQNFVKESDDDDFETEDFEADETEDADETDGDDEAEISEIEKRIMKNVRAEIANKSVEKDDAEGDDEEEDPALADDPDDTEEQRENKRLRRENMALAKRVQAAEIKRLEHEILSVQGKYKLSDEQLETVARYFEKNTDLEGVWSFERATLRVFPELRDHTVKPEPERNGAGARPRPEKVAKVVDRGAGASGPPKPFKTTPGRGQYGDVVAGLLRSGRSLTRF